MSVATAILRWVYGLFYLFVGVAWFVHRILDKPWVMPEKNEAATTLVNALTASGIVDPFIASVCLIGGTLLLVRRTCPLGIAVLAPLVSGIFIFHLFLTGDWIWGGIHFGLLVLLTWSHRSAFRSLVSFGASRAA